MCDNLSQTIPPGSDADADVARSPDSAAANEKWTAACDVSLPLETSDALSDGSLTVVAFAVDKAPSANRTEVRIKMNLATETAVFSVTPSTVALAGGNEIVISGNLFPPGTTVWIRDTPLEPAGAKSSTTTPPLWAEHHQVRQGKLNLKSDPLGNALSSHVL